MAFKCWNCDLLIQTSLESAESGLQCPGCGKKISKGDWVIDEKPSGGGKGRIHSPETPTVVQTAERAPPRPEIPDHRYEKWIGGGGMGDVWLGTQHSLDRKVAIKVLKEELSKDEGFLVRFEREAKAMARLSHPSVVRIFNRGHSEGIHYFTMEYVEGPGGGPPFTLADRIAAGKIPPLEAQEIFLQVCAGLEAAHEEGIVHRDVKPGNILLDKAGRVKLSDFGIARVGARGGAGAPELTLPTTVMGTIRYMAPEQETDPQSVDRRADVYSAGKVLFHMLTGSEPPLKGALPPLSRLAPDLHPEWESALRRATADDRERRYPDMASFRRAVEGIQIEGETIPPREKERKPRLDDLIREAREALDQLDLNRAEVAIREAAEIDRSHPEVQWLSGQLGKLQVREWAARAKEAYGSSDFEECVRKGKLVLASEPGNAEIARMVKLAAKAQDFVEKHLEKARLSRGEGDLAGALERCERVLKSFPDQKEARSLRSQCQEDIRRAEGAFVRARRSIEEGDPRGAREALSEAESLVPRDDPRISRLRGEVEELARSSRSRKLAAYSAFAIAIPLIALVGFLGYRYVHRQDEERSIGDIDIRADAAKDEIELRSVIQDIGDFLKDHPDYGDRQAVEEKREALRRRLAEKLLEPLVQADGARRLRKSPAECEGNLKALLEDGRNMEIRSFLEERYKGARESEEKLRYSSISDSLNQGKLDGLEEKIAEYLKWFPDGPHAKDASDLLARLPSEREKVIFEAFEKEFKDAKGNPTAEILVCNDHLPRIKSPKDRAEVERRLGDAQERQKKDGLDRETKEFDDFNGKVKDLLAKGEHENALSFLDAYLESKKDTPFKGQIAKIREEILSAWAKADLEKALRDGEAAFKEKKYLLARKKILEFCSKHPDCASAPEAVRKLIDFSSRLSQDKERREAIEFLLAAWECAPCDDGLMKRLVGLGLVWKKGKWTEQGEYAKEMKDKIISGKDGKYSWNRVCTECEGKGQVQCSWDGKQIVDKIYIKNGKRMKNSIYNLKCAEALKKYGQKCGECSGDGLKPCENCKGKGSFQEPVDWQTECDPCDRNSVRKNSVR